MSEDTILNIVVIVCIAFCIGCYFIAQGLSNRGDD